MYRYGYVGAWWLAVGLLAGCTTAQVKPTTQVPSHHGDVSYRQSTAPGQTTYQLAMGQAAVGSTLQSDPAPIYPADLIARALPPQEITAQVIVGTDGAVSDVRVTGEAAADDTTRRFIDAVRQAVRQWHYSPLVISRWAADANGVSHVVDSQAQPFSQVYTFRFECRDGKPVITRG